MKKLIIVESPTKVHTISKFLGKDYIVKASMGHIIDLPKSRIGIEVDKDFEPKYIVMRDKARILKDIKEAAERSDIIYLATDPDREGEAISWHLRNAILEEKKSKSKKIPVKPKVVKVKQTFRVVFNEITKKAVISAIENPRDLDMNLVYAQQSRRILDRLVGYMISPLLWKNVQSGLSAGRVQSVALRMICEREKEITAFKPEEYWSVEALLKGVNPPQFTAKLSQINGEKFKIATKEEGDKIVAECQKHPFIVKKIESKEKNRYSPAPFITSTLQQEASKKLGFTSRKTMMIAQQLYEGLDVGEEGEVGLITYMRTDSVRIADEALAEVRGLIGEKYGQENLPEKPNFYKNK
ncbi:MAG: type I DNA topoisomerase, partial [Candidatus Firestonebacteria bacterium]|nr:type I DNA topoisomerase [Candidatus Firestonebacteria bacterium]